MLKEPRSYSKPVEHLGIRYSEKGARTHIFLLLWSSIQTPVGELSLGEPPAESLVINLIEPIQNSQCSNTHKHCGVIGIRNEVRSGVQGYVYLGQHDSRRQCNCRIPRQNSYIDGYKTLFAPHRACPSDQAMTKQPPRSRETSCPSLQTCPQKKRLKVGGEIR